MADDGSSRTGHGDFGKVRERSHPRLRSFARRLKRNRLGLAALLPAAAMAAVFVAEPFAGMATVDQPTPPPATITGQPISPGHAGLGR